MNLVGIFFLIKENKAIVYHLCICVSDGLLVRDIVRKMKLYLKNIYLLFNIKIDQNDNINVYLYIIGGALSILNRSLFTLSW